MDWYANFQVCMWTNMLGQRSTTFQVQVSLFLLHLFMNYWENNICFKLVTGPLFWSQTIQFPFLLFFPLFSKICLPVYKQDILWAAKLMKFRFLWTAFCPVDTSVVRDSMWNYSYVVWLLANVYSLWPWNCVWIKLILIAFSW